MELQHARGARPPLVGRPRHARDVRGGLLRARFGAMALVPAVVLGLGTGAATGALAAPDPVVASPAALGVQAVANDPTSEPADPTDAAAADATTGVVDDAASASPFSAAGDLAEDAVATSTVIPLADLVPDLPADRASAVPAGLSAEDVMAGLLSLDTPTSASGDLVVVPGSTPAPDPDTSVRTVRVEVEDGLPIDPEKFATLVMGILNNPQGWGADGRLSFARTDGDDQDVRVVLASPDKIDAMCAPLTTNGEYSCGRYGHAAINYTRWVSGADAFDDMTTYRQYVINHEVGHLLGHPHVSCPSPGELAPIMMQQTISVATCVPNGWPYPEDA